MDDEDTETRLGRLTCIDPPDELRQAGGGHGGWPWGWRSRHPACPGLRATQGLTRGTPLRCAPLAWRWRRRGSTAMSFASPAMAATPLSRSCPIRIISVHLLDAAGQLLRVLFLDREGHISAEPHYVPREQALILAANQQRVLGPQAEVRVL
ncbi:MULTISPECIES: hypothetical protein [unclassified Cyanobium]|uniref:hypothetical protein n=2 Tax=Cyanophyceae TaxID=3028117 RepID=UPI0020CCDA38|nr:MULTISPECIES: hypothetical protein [unclassified Cyanobium]MCP9860265.1 hypothetical protein [Cyanobium sp. Cruz-8H5]MCP9867081.1 hypothetical protein [Cyanobium sp. Cruz-8D1]